MLKSGAPSAEITKRADLGMNRRIAQTRALCWKLLKIGTLCAKMTKRADLGLKTLFWTTSWTLLKIGNEPAHEWVAY